MPEFPLDNPVSVRQREALPLPALQAWLRAEVPGIGEVQNVLQFPGGYSNLTYCLQTATQDYILRRPPAGASIKGGHDMSREFRVLTLLQPHYNNIPTLAAYCADESIIGAPFYIMQRIKGVILRTTNAPKLQLSPAWLHQLSEALVDNLVVLHQLDIEKTELIQLGKPEGYVARQVDGWVKRYHHAATDNIIAMDEIAAWLQGHQPTPNAPTLLHNDYKYDNIIWQFEAAPSIAGVLDWEMATVGDPLMDLGATLAYWMEAMDADVLRQFNFTWLPGNYTRAEVLARYAEQSGRDLSNMLFYYVFGLFKNAVIAQQIYARWKQGHSSDARFGSLMPVIMAMAQKASDTLHQGRI